MRRGSAAPADNFNFPGQQHLQRLASSLKQQKINVQPIPLKGADFLGDVERFNAAADARQAEQ